MQQLADAGINLSHENILFEMNDNLHSHFCICLCFFWIFARLYAVGGRDGSSCLRSMECFDPHTNKWVLCSPMSRRRGGVGVTTCNGYLYAVGGHDAPASNPTSSRFDCVERWCDL